MNIYNYIKENILVPRNLEVRKEKLRQQNIKILSQDIIEGDLVIDETFENIPLELIKVKEIKGNVILNLNYISLWLKDVKIDGYFNCSYNNLITLDNCPQYVGGNFYCSNNQLTSLDGCPKYVGGYFKCRYNKKILELPNNIQLNGIFYN